MRKVKVVVYGTIEEGEAAEQDLDEGLALFFETDSSNVTVYSIDPHFDLKQEIKESHAQIMDQETVIVDQGKVITDLRAEIETLTAVTGVPEDG
jgi:hypothetical protein